MSDELSAAKLAEEQEYTEKLEQLLILGLRARPATDRKKRALHPKALAGFHGAFTVLPDLPDNLKVGLFARPATYEARLRFSNASAIVESDQKKGIRGLAIKLLDVPGTKLNTLPDGGDPGHDFILNSHPIMPIPDVKGFYEMTLNLAKGTALRYFLNPFDPHPGVLLRLLASAKSPDCPVELRYWSMTPYRFGNDRFVKYSLVPTSAHAGPRIEKSTADYLGTAARSHIKHATATYDFMVQIRSDPRRMPLENATVDWDEHRAPFVPVARLEIPKQEPTPEQEAAVEALRFSPWHALPEHEPVGGINRARRRIYEKLSQVRLGKKG